MFIEGIQVEFKVTHWLKLEDPLSQHPNRRHVGELKVTWQKKRGIGDIKHLCYQESGPKLG